MNTETHMKSDTKLQQDVMDELKWEPSVNATQIGVEVKDGIVTLDGHVSSFAEKWHAERAAQRVSGVRGLTVEMDVALPSSSVRNDVDLAKSAENVLQWMTYWTKDSVKVMVEKGWITLSGEVDWEYQRMAAAAAVRFLTGVNGVSNQITIKSKITASVVKFDIEASLKRVAKSEAKNIDVEVNGTEIVLSGKVHSWSEREAATQSAWRAPGVRKVTDNITVTY